jgi:hypothetical protein
MTTAADKARYQTLKKLYGALGDCAYSLAVFGDHLAKREKYREHLDIDAIHFYIVHKFNWPPAQVRGMSFEDLRFVLSEEMSGWTMPPAAR